ncbi:SprT family protein [Psychrobacillus sp. NEAU-3TGS]|uniref:SprT family protein n=1 Tax=Psychrobacillus sp. NEAU-3TGS TaxID=2995412 RepID=UPI00249749BC|nr:SprT family protein [Psychrobacillus sp. NEAU-3TGS]MDI2586055.1 SprT family protein [Psychrobacillus sp. NEAU-3TGS]
MTDEKLTELVCSVSKEVFRKDFRHDAYFNKRLRTTGGRYMLRTHHIEINPLVFEKHGMDELIGVIKHELCHYHLHIEGKGYKHRDADFRELLKRTNSPRFCSTLVEREERERSKIYTYQCAKCSLLYNRKIRLNTSKYRCGKCLGDLILVSSKKLK